MFSHTIRTEIDMNATPEIVWGILMDQSAYPDWNPFIQKISGSLQPKGRLLIQIGEMKFKPQITHFEPQKRLTWLGSLGIPGLFDGVHTFQLIKQEDNSTRFIHQESFRGLLIPLTRKVLSKTKRGFQDMNIALKQRAEAFQGID